MVLQQVSRRVARVSQRRRVSGVVGSGGSEGWWCSEWKGRSAPGCKQRLRSATNTPAGVLLRCSRGALRESGSVIDQRMVVVSVVDGGSSKTGRSSVVVLLCERALWPGEANAQPPVGRALIGGAAEMQCTHEHEDARYADDSGCCCRRLPSWSPLPSSSSSSSSSKCQGKSRWSAHKKGSCRC